MSFALTTEQIINETKRVTRRNAWWNLKAGEQLWAVEKGMGLKKGEKVNRLKKITVVSTRKEHLHQITGEDCALEGFPDMKPYDFIEFYLLHNGGSYNQYVNRIEFRYGWDS